MDAVPNASDDVPAPPNRDMRDPGRDSRSAVEYVAEESLEDLGGSPRSLRDRLGKASSCDRSVALESLCSDVLSLAALMRADTYADKRADARSSS